MRAHYVGSSFGILIGLSFGCGDGMISDMKGSAVVPTDGAAADATGAREATSSTGTTASSTSSGAGGAGGGTNGGTGGTTGDAGSLSPRAWRPFSDSSPWNTPLPANPSLAADSSTLVADLTVSSAWPYITINIESYSIPVYFADSTTGMSSVDVSVLGGQGFETKHADVPIPAGAAPAQGTDKHLSIVSRQTNQEWGFWDATRTSSTSWTCSVCAAADLSGTGVRPPKDGQQAWWLSHGARACGFPLVAGLITVDEMRAGKIEHALAIAYPHIRSHWYTPPASTAQVTTDRALPTRGIPCGGRVQLDPALNLDTLGLSRSGRIVARALQEYGAFVGDFSGAVSLYADSSPDAQTAWKTGLLGTFEVKDQIDLRKLRVIAMGRQYEDTN